MNTLVESANNVLRQTYMLLSATLLFSAAMTGLGVLMEIGPITSTVAWLLGFVLIFVIPRYQNSQAGIYLVFLFTGLMGFSLGPVIQAYIDLPNGSAIIGTATLGTGLIFAGLSAYAIKTGKDFSFMGGFLISALLGVIIILIANLFMQIAWLHLLMSYVILLLMSGFILYDTSAILHRDETNYISATVGLYLDIINMFLALLNIVRSLMGEK